MYELNHKETKFIHAGCSFFVTKDLQEESAHLATFYCETHFGRIGTSLKFEGWFLTMALTLTRASIEFVVSGITGFEFFS
jgi:hypothetical protein